MSISTNNGMLKPGTYVVRFPAERYTQLRSDCWYDWQERNGVTLESEPWDPPSRTGIDLVDEQALAAAAWAEQRKFPDWPINKIGKDGDVYQAFSTETPVPFWDFRGACAFAAWPWDGKQDLELAATGRIAEPYTELDAAADAADATVTVAAETVAELPKTVAAAAEAVADATPAWVKVAVTIVLLGVAGYAIRALK